MSIENVLGFDLETTGLDPQADGILEIGMQVIAPNWDTLDQFQALVKQPEDVLNRMAPAVRAQHERSGLLKLCAEDGLTPLVVWEETAQFVQKWFPRGRAILMGFSVHFDRSFVKARMPDLEKLLHYRMIDVSSIREARRIFGSKHRTMADIVSAKEALREMIR